MSNIISWSKVTDYERLSDRLLALRALVGTARREEPEAVASAAMARAASVLLADLYRLVSREPGGRTLPRLAESAPPTHRQLAAILRDAGLLLDQFRQAHLDHDGETGDEWLTREGLEALAERAAARKTYPRP